MERSRSSKEVDKISTLKEADGKIIMLAATTCEHIARDENGVPVIVGANTKVVELVSEMHAYGWSPAELHFQHPHLSMGQIHSALAYYWDHREEIDADRERRFQDAEKMRDQTGDTPIREKLRCQHLG